jgi:hypothetical protein
VDAILIGLVAIAAGALLCFYGYRAFVIALPIWGFLIGFEIGANMIAFAFNHGFLADLAGWALGILVGVGFAAAAYFFYWVAIVFLAAGLGVAAGIAISDWLLGGVPIITGFLAAAGGIALGTWAYQYHAARWIVVGLTAAAGATTLVGGALVLIGRVPVAAIGHGAISGFLREGGVMAIVWLAAAVALAVAGFYVQDRVTAKDWKYDPLLRTTG